MHGFNNKNLHRYFWEVHYFSTGVLYITMHFFEQPPPGAFSYQNLRHVIIPTTSDAPTSSHSTSESCSRPAKRRSAVNPNNFTVPKSFEIENSDPVAIKAAATIYKKQDIRPLTQYQIKINEAAQNICLSNPSKLRNHSALLEAAKAIVNQSYEFKKGESRSKKCSSDTSPSVTKRKKSTIPLG
uniref:Uncharacterized protein n=1 Tax=Amphimedon queenslandica TaxID=400682 RepID=A0A1X7VJN1_AMPQE